ncbi:hypothetical protein K1719_001834 [Acacia pycnantha]|nr:hypothetical protein K1719_001834 [Acacia pycnantha]
MLRGPFSSLIPFKPSSSSFPSNLSASLRLQFTRATCSLQISPSTSESQQQHRVLRRNVVEILEERGLLESITSDSLRTACSDPAAGSLKVYCGFDPTAESLHLGNNLLGLIVISWFRRWSHKAVALIGGATTRIGDPSGKTLERPELDADTLEKNILGISNVIRRILAERGINVQIGGSDQWGNITAGTELIRKILQAEGAYGLTFPLLLKSDGKKNKVLVRIA